MQQNKLLASLLRWLSKSNVTGEVSAWSVSLRLISASISGYANLQLLGQFSWGHDITDISRCVSLCFGWSLCMSLKLGFAYLAFTLNGSLLAMILGIEANVQWHAKV